MKEHFQTTVFIHIKRLGLGLREKHVGSRKHEKYWLFKVLLGFEPRISCLQNRHFHQLSHSTRIKGQC